MSRPEPRAWMVFCPSNHEYDYQVFIDEREAEDFADDGTETPPDVIPLYTRDGAPGPALLALAEWFDGNSPIIDNDETTVGFLVQAVLREAGLLKEDSNGSA